jgi:hypothetical protein
MPYVSTFTTRPLEAQLFWVSEIRQPLRLAQSRNVSARFYLSPRFADCGKSLGSVKQKKIFFCTIRFPDLQGRRRDPRSSTLMERKQERVTNIQRPFREG